MTYLLILFSVIWFIVGLAVASAFFHIMNTPELPEDRPDDENSY